MPTPYDPAPPNDTQRDARKYARLVRALENATATIERFTDQADADLDAALEQLLPDLRNALDAKIAFTGRVIPAQATSPAELDITGIYPGDGALRPGMRLPIRGTLADVLRDGKPKVADPTWLSEPHRVIGLETLEADEAIVVCTRNLTPVRIVGVCNKRNARLGPYLAADGQILDEIIELIAIGARIGERHLGDLRAIQEASSEALRRTKLDELLRFISERAAEVFQADATGVLLWDATHENLVIRAHHHLPEADAGAVRVPRARVEAVQSLSQRGPLMFANLRAADPAEAAAPESRIRSTLSAPLMVNGALRGFLNIYSKAGPRGFSAKQRELVTIYANQIAIALENARLFDAERRRSRHWEALHASGKAITAGVSTDRRVVLARIVAEAVRLSDINGPPAMRGILQLYDRQKNELAFESVHPATFWETLRGQMGDRRSLDRAVAPSGRIGITGHAVLESRSQRVDDVRLDPDYVEFNPTTASEVAAPLRDGDEVIGVLSLESEEPAAFDQDDEMALSALADLAVIAIHNSEAAADLSRANAVAMLGAWAADVMHDINREIAAIRRSVYILKQQPRLKESMRVRLIEIDRDVDRLAAFALPEEMAQPGMHFDPLHTTTVDAMIAAQLAASDEQHPTVVWCGDLNCPDIRVAMHEQWLSRLLRHLIRNALDAMEGKAEPVIRLRTLVDGAWVYIEVEDNGRGVRPEIEHLLFNQPIPHDGSARGRGLLLARFLVEQHGGEIASLHRRPGEGACFRVSLPVAAPV